ncbi:MAG: hypothetical protein E6929_07480 [Clostridium sp.]|nr:hypothetical protein [Clostridium sp.]
MIKSDVKYNNSPSIVMYNLIDKSEEVSDNSTMDETYDEPVDYETAFKKYYPKENKSNDNQNKS